MAQRGEFRLGKTNLKLIYEINPIFHQFYFYCSFRQCNFGANDFRQIRRRGGRSAVRQTDRTRLANLQNRTRHRARMDYGATCCKIEKCDFDCNKDYEISKIFHRVYFSSGFYRSRFGIGLKIITEIFNEKQTTKIH